MLTKITEQELHFFETLRNPTSCTEILFSDIGNLSDYSPDKYSEVRKYQYPFQSYEYLFCYDNNKSKKENFKDKKKFADAYVFGGRLTGKSRIAIVIDSLLSLFHNTFTWGAISSLDALHLKGVFEPILSVLENHPIFKILKAHTLRNPYRIEMPCGTLIEGVNHNILGKNPGNQWFAKHIDKNWEEEGSFLTKEVSNKKRMAASELGLVERLSGMTTFSQQSPVGIIFYDMKNKRKIVNLPSYVNPTWDENKNEDALIEFGGKNSAGFQVQIEGKVVENCDATYDIQRIRECYNHKVEIKAYDITDTTFYKYRDLIIVDRPKNVERVFICLDKGEGSAPTEVIVIFKIGDKYRYEYNITLNKLILDQEDEILDYVIQALKANIIGIDCTSGGGKDLFSKLGKKYPKQIQWVSFNEKLPVDVERDEDGNTKIDNNGKPIYREEYVIVWSVQRIKQLFYNKKIDCLLDYKLDQQFANNISKTSGLRTVFSSKVPDHLHQAFQVFSICEWRTEFINIEEVQQEKPGFGFFN